MHFETPTEQVAFEIPDEWWQFAEMDAFSSKGGRFYPYRPLRDAQEVDAVPLSDIEPPMRNSGVPPFKKYKMVPILFALCSPECALPPVKVDALAASAAHGGRGFQPLRVTAAVLSATLKADVDHSSPTARVS